MEQFDVAKFLAPDTTGCQVDGKEEVQHGVEAQDDVVMQESSPRDNNLDSDTTAPFGKSVNMNADRANERNLPSSETGSPLSELERALSVLAKHCDPMVLEHLQVKLLNQQRVRNQPQRTGSEYSRTGSKQSVEQQPRHSASLQELQYPSYQYQQQMLQLQYLPTQQPLQPQQSPTSHYLDNQRVSQPSAECPQPWRNFSNPVPTDTRFGVEASFAPRQTRARHISIPDTGMPNSMYAVMQPTSVQASNQVPVRTGSLGSCDEWDPQAEQESNGRLRDVERRWSHSSGIAAHAHAPPSNHNFESQRVTEMFMPRFFMPRSPARKRTSVPGSQQRVSSITGRRSVKSPHYHRKDHRARRSSMKNSISDPAIPSRSVSAPLSAQHPVTSFQQQNLLQQQFAQQQMHQHPQQHAYSGSSANSSDSPSTSVSPRNMDHDEALSSFLGDHHALEQLLARLQAAAPTNAEEFEAEVGQNVFAHHIASRDQSSVVIPQHPQLTPQQSEFHEMMEANKWKPQDGKMAPLRKKARSRRVAQPEARERKKRQHQITERKRRDRFRRALVELREVMEQIVGNDVDIGKTVLLLKESVALLVRMMKEYHQALEKERLLDEQIAFFRQRRR